MEQDPKGTSPRVLWRRKLNRGRGIPSAAVDDGVVVTGGGFGSYDMYGLDAKTGEPLWRHRTKDDGPTAAVVSGSFVAYNTESCTLEVLDVKTGTRLWSHWLGDPMLAQPAIGSRQVYAVYPSRGGHSLGAFRLEDGEPLWSVRLAHDVITAPVLVGSQVYLSTFDGSVHAVDAGSGQMLWTRQMGATSAPWVHGSEVFVSHRSDDHTGPEAEPAPSERTSRFERGGGTWRASYERKRAEYLDASWGRQRKGAYALWDSAAGFGSPPGSAKLDRVKELLGEASVSRAWRYQGSRPVVADGVLYDTTGDRLEARALDTGALIWSWQTDGVEGERRITPPAVANGRVWIGTWGGSVVSFDAKTGGIRWDASLGVPVHWQPVVCGGRIFAGLQNGELVCLETGDPLDDGWPMWGGGPGHNGA